MTTDYSPRKLPSRPQIYYTLATNTIIAKECHSHRGTYAAVAAKFSTRSAFVINVRASEKEAVKAAITPSLTLMSRTTYSTTMPAMGSMDAITVAKIDVKLRSVISL